MEKCKGNGNKVGKLQKFRERVGIVQKGKKSERKGDFSKNLRKISNFCIRKAGIEGYEG